MKFRFKPEDFSEGSTCSITKRLSIAASEIANKLLDTHLGTLHRVYGSSDGESWESKKFDYTHQAILFDIEEIEKPKPCEHEPSIYGGMYEPTCQKCDAILIPTGWQTVEG